MQLSVNVWTGPGVVSHEVDEPTAADVRAAFDGGSSGLEVSLSVAEPFACLTASGGPDLYLVTGETADEQILQLTEPEAGDEAVALVTGGQLAAYPRHGLVTGEQATAALLRFLEHAVHDPALPWDTQG